MLYEKTSMLLPISASSNKLVVCPNEINNNVKINMEKRYIIIPFTFNVGLKLTPPFIVLFEEDK